MSRFITGLIALAALSAAPFSQAKPPGLPEPLVITVQPIQIMPIEFQAPIAEVALPTSRSVLDNLSRLIEAGEELAMAKKLAESGNLAGAIERATYVRKLVPGSTLDEDAVELVNGLGCGNGCCPCFGTFVKAARCWLSQAEAWARQAEKRAAKDGKKVMVDGLLKAAHLAVGEGRMDKAAELVRQAHALSPERVEADPLVYKMHLLEEKPARGGEEASEPPQALRDHPKQVRKVNKVSLSPEAKEVFRAVSELVVAGRFSLMSPPKDANGVLMIGLGTSGLSVAVHTRCPATGVTWHVCLGGSLPVVWPTME